MAQVDSNGIQIEYDTFGEPGSRPLLLIMGSAGQLNLWDEELCKKIAQQGHYVIRFDNRDVGLSTKIDEAEAKADKFLADFYPMIPRYIPGAE